MPEDPLEAAFVTPEEVAGENRTKLAKMIIPLVAIDPENGVVHFKRAGDALNAKQKVLVYLLSRLALSTRNPAFPPTATPKQIEEETNLPGGTVRPKLSELVKERIVFQGKDGYSVRPPNISRAWHFMENAMPKEEREEKDNGQS